MVIPQCGAHDNAGGADLVHRKPMSALQGGVVPDSSAGWLTPEILFERRGAAGLVTFNRPKALNAVTLGMVRAFTAQLAKWADDPAVTRVVLSRGRRARVLGGGDIRALYDLGRAGRLRRDAAVLARGIHPQRFDQALSQTLCLADRRHRDGRWRRSLGARLASRRRRPIFVCHARGRASDFFPMSGATWFLPRMPGELGAYCALTGERLRAADGVVCVACDASRRVGALCRIARRAVRCHVRSMRCWRRLQSRPETQP